MENIMKYLRILSILTFSASLLGTGLAFAGKFPLSKEESIEYRKTIQVLPAKAEPSETEEIPGPSSLRSERTPELTNETPLQSSPFVTPQLEEKKEETVPVQSISFPPKLETTEVPSQSIQPVSSQPVPEEEKVIVPPIVMTPEPKIEIPLQTSQPAIPVTPQPVQEIPQQANTSPQPAVFLGYTEERIGHNVQTEVTRGAESVVNLITKGVFKSNKKLKKLKLGKFGKKSKKH